MATVTTPLRIGPADRGRTMTLEEFLAAGVEEGYRYELARGVLEVNQVANDPNARNTWPAAYMNTGSSTRWNCSREVGVPGIL